MDLTPAQDIIAADIHRFRVLCCGRRFGKTTLAREEIKAFALSKTSNICYIATTFAQSRDILWQDLKRELSSITISANEARLELKVRSMNLNPLLPQNKEKAATIFLKGWEAVDSLRGQSFDFIVIDEVASMREFWTNWREVVRPTLTDRKGEALFISTPKGFNHFYELFNMQEKDDDFKSFHYTTFDNPNIPPEEVLKAKSELPEDAFSQEYLADFTKTEGLVYKEFRRETHVVDPADAPAVFVELLVGIDFGYSNPAAVLSIYRDSSDCLWVMKELYERKKTDAEVAEYAAALKGNRYYADPAAASGVEELKRKRVNVREVIKGADSIKHGIDAVREMLKANKLKISNQCTNLILELETYSYPDKKPFQNENENPIKENDHACFSEICQVYTPQGQQSIKDTKIGQLVWSGLGWTRVLGASLTGTQKVIQVTFDDGSTIEGTSNHPIFVMGKGLVLLGELKYNDHVCKSDTKKLYSMDFPTEDTPMLQKVPHDSNISIVQKQKNCFTEKSTVRNMDFFQMIWMSTIRMAIQPITSSLIWYYSRKQNIPVFISSKNPKIRTLVNNAIRFLDPESKGHGVLPRFAIKIAELISTIEQKNISSDVSAPFVGRKYSKIGDKGQIATVRVVSVHHGNEEKPVYNLATEAGMFVANGIWVSNCDALRYVIMMAGGGTGSRAAVYYPGTPRKMGTKGAAVHYYQQRGRRSVVR